MANADSTTPNSPVSLDNATGSTTHYAVGVVMEKSKYGNLFIGTEGALIAAGLAEADWFPGKPGNNTTSQTIVFDKTGPCLLKGRGNRAKGDDRFNRITISRSNPYKDCYTVQKCLTKEQHYELKRKNKIEREELSKKLDRERQAEKFERANPKPLSLGEFRSKCTHYATFSLELIRATMDDSGIRYNIESMSGINHAYAEIFAVLAGGGIQSKPSLAECSGNVIYLNSQSIVTPEVS